MGAALRLEALARTIERAHAEGRFPTAWQSATFQREVSDVLGHLVAIASHTTLASSYARESRRVGVAETRPDIAADAPATSLDAPGDALDVAYALRFIELARPAVAGRESIRTTSRRSSR